MMSGQPKQKEVFKLVSQPKGTKGYFEDLKEVLAILIKIKKRNRKNTWKWLLFVIHKLTSLWLTLMVILNVCVLFACLFACYMQMSCNLSCHIALNPQMDRCWLTPTNLATWSHFRIILPQLFAIFRSLIYINYYYLFCEDFSCKNFT